MPPAASPTTEDPPTPTTSSEDKPQSEAGATPCSDFLSASQDDEVQIIRQMLQELGQGTSAEDVATALGSARAYCGFTPDGSIIGIYG